MTVTYEDMDSDVRLAVHYTTMTDVSVFGMLTDARSTRVTPDDEARVGPSGRNVMKRQWRTGRGAALAVTLGILVISAAPAPAGPVIQVEGEDYIGYNDLGGMLIQSVPCAGTSGYTVADGIDVPGEWITLSLDVQTAGCYSVVGAFQSRSGYSIGMLLTLTGSRAASVEFEFVGEGLG